eukprot:3765817-Rhodomonas_salina.1
MNLIQALQTWGRRDFLSDMTRQKNTDIIQGIMILINGRTARLTIVKVKSHRGVSLNETADRLAGQITGDEDAELLFELDQPDNQRTTGDGDNVANTLTANPNAVGK